jgi:hypothetical protein
MQNRPPTEPDPEALPEPMAARLLARASELDVARDAGSSVADLRAAAAEAGISTHSFDAALAELQGNVNAPAPDVLNRPRQRSRMRASTTALVALVAAGALAVFYERAATGEAAVPGAPIVEEAILLRCLSPGEAAELIRPLLPLSSNSVVYSAARAPRVLTIRATEEQLQNVKSMLDKYEAAESGACAALPTGH